MAKGRTTVHRRKRTTHARNTLPRKSSPEGKAARLKRRLKGHPQNDVFAPGGQTGPKPGSLNSSKVGR